MRLLAGGILHCKRCGSELERGDESCPRCGFNPKQMGLRVSMVLFLVVVGSMTLVMVLPRFWIGLAPYLVGLAAVSFALTVLTFVVSFLITPYRFGSLFARF